MNADVDLDETQVFEPAGKKWKQDDVAKDMLTSEAPSEEQPRKCWHNWPTMPKRGNNAWPIAWPVILI